jgi:hypothetical protein
MNKCIKHKSQPEDRRFACTASRARWKARCLALRFMPTMLLDRGGQKCVSAAGVFKKKIQKIFGKK